jgi:hypothetical protein
MPGITIGAGSFSGPGIPGITVAGSDTPPTLPALALALGVEASRDVQGAAAAGGFSVRDGVSKENCRGSTGPV